MPALFIMMSISPHSLKIFCRQSSNASLLFRLSLIHISFAWVDGQMAHVITSVDIDHQKKIEEELRVAKDLSLIHIYGGLPSTGSPDGKEVLCRKK